jgi:hypothetical protein
MQHHNIGWCIEYTRQANLNRLWSDLPGEASGGFRFTSEGFLLTHRLWGIMGGWGGEAAPPLIEKAKDGSVR